MARLRLDLVRGSEHNLHTQKRYSRADTPEPCRAVNQSHLFRVAHGESEFSSCYSDWQWAGISQISGRVIRQPAVLCVIYCPDGVPSEPQKCPAVLRPTFGGPARLSSKSASDLGHRDVTAKAAGGHAISIKPYLRHIRCVEEVLISQFRLPGVPGSSVSSGGPPCARSGRGPNRQRATRERFPSSGTPMPVVAAASVPCSETSTKALWTTSIEKRYAEE
jgi:hypothetical protein